MLDALTYVSAYKYFMHAQQAWGIVIQEGRFDLDDYVPRDKHEIR